MENRERINQHDRDRYRQKERQEAIKFSGKKYTSSPHGKAKLADTHLKRTDRKSVV